MPITEENDWRKYRTFNKDTGEEIAKCFFADDETGEYGVYCKNKNGKIYMNADHTGAACEFFKGNIEIRESETANAS